MKPQRVKIWKKGRLEYYSKVADAFYWDNLWEGQITEEYFEKYKKGVLDEYFPYFERYLSRDDRIIEAGCGTARYVVALLARGYKNVTGIDWGQSTIQKVKAIFPEIPIEVGDVTNINVNDSFYDGYISLGVVEHREQGPEPFLREAYRITKQGGYALISVPYLNHLRLIKARLGVYKSTKVNDLSFYQYAFQKSEFIHFLEKVGFKVLEVNGVSGWFGIREEIPFLALLLDTIPGGYRIQAHLRKSKFLDRFGHMALYICTK